MNANFHIYCGLGRTRCMNTLLSRCCQDKLGNLDKYRIFHSFGENFLFAFLFWINKENSSTGVLAEDTLYRCGLFTDGDKNVLYLLNFPRE